MCTERAVLNWLTEDERPLVEEQLQRSMMALNPLHDLALEDFIKERRLQAQQELVSMCNDLRDAIWAKQLEVINLLPSRWDNVFDLDFSEEQKKLDELKTLTERIHNDTVIIEKLEEK